MHSPLKCACGVKRWVQDTHHLSYCVPKVTQNCPPLFSYDSSEQENPSLYSTYHLSVSQSHPPPLSSSNVHICGVKRWVCARQNTHHSYSPYKKVTPNCPPLFSYKQANRNKEKRHARAVLAFHLTAYLRRNLSTQVNASNACGGTFYSSFEFRVYLDFFWRLDLWGWVGLDEREREGVIFCVDVWNMAFSSFGCLG